MATEAERYLRKAQESLASAEADLAAGRYNSAGNRAYYAAFQAAVAALIHWRIRAPDTEWQHRFVQDEFADKLVNRRKTFPAALRGSLEKLFKVRIKADYEPHDVSQKAGMRAVKQSADLVRGVESAMLQRGVQEPRIDYNVSMKPATRDPKDIVEEFKARILATHPDADFKVIQRAERDYTIKVYGDDEDMDEVVEKALGDAPIDALTEHDAWIVVLGLERLPLDS